LSEDAVIEPPGFLLRPQRNLLPFDTSICEVLDWVGTDIRKESQRQERRSDSIQYKMINRLAGSGLWDIVIDDDGSGEVADIVAVSVRDEVLTIGLTHCKYSGEETPGARVADLYEVCGQAMKSTYIRRDIPNFFARLIKRERGRVQRGKRSGFMVGTSEQLLNLRDRSRLLRPAIHIEIVQPGASLSLISTPMLHLLAGAQVYLRETAGATLSVVLSQ
jgi:hypothetical protein